MPLTPPKPTKAFFLRAALVVPVSVDRVWNCLFGAGTWVGDRGNWIRVVGDMGFSGDAFLRFIASEGAEIEYRNISIAAQERGVFGVPKATVLEAAP